MEPATEVSESKHRHKKGTLRFIFIYGLSFLGLLWLILFNIPITEHKKHPMFKKSRPLVMAHRGGAALAPENTLAAFHNAVELGVDMIELDIHATKDGHLVVIHDDTIDRTTNGSGRVNDLTLAEIQAYDAGFHFIDPDGNKSFKGKGVNVPTLEAVFREMPRDMRYTIELKDTNDPDLYEEIGRDLWQLMAKYDVQDRVLIGSFDEAILEMITTITKGKAVVSAGKQEVTKFILLHKLGLHALYKSRIDSIELPTDVIGINLINQTIIDTAKTRGIDIHYWTVNDTETMEQLMNKGVDGIITDRPDLLIDVVQGR